MSKKPTLTLVPKGKVKAKAKPKAKEPNPTGIRAMIAVRGKVGQPGFKPTPELQEIVRDMAAAGLPHTRIAHHMDISEPTLRKYFDAELDAADEGVANAIKKGLIEQAIAGNVTAAIFIAKTRAGWREQPTQLDIKSENVLDPNDKQAIVGRIMALMEARLDPQPVDITPPKVIDHEPSKD